MGQVATPFACSLMWRVRDNRKEVGRLPACSRCLVEVPLGTALCPKCGAAIRPPVLPRPTPKRVGKSRQRLNDLDPRDRVMGPASLVLLVSFWLPWYSFGPISASGLSAHGWLFIAVVDSIVVVLYVLISAFGVGDLAVQGRMSKDQLLALITGVNLALVVLGVLLKPAAFSWSWGAFVALAAAVVACRALWRSPHPGPPAALNPSRPCSP